jgi:hypothetical protein
VIGGHVSYQTNSLVRLHGRRVILHLPLRPPYALVLFKSQHSNSHNLNKHSNVYLMRIVHLLTTFQWAKRLWKGGEAAKKQGDMSCPDCGSQNIFVRTAKGGNTMISGNAPAPRCFECGWNGIYDQGSQSSWAV